MTRITGTRTWEILIATLGQRSARFRALLDALLPQTEPYDGRVVVRALWNNGERSLREVRQLLLDDSAADYVSFVDDDDELPNYHVAEVMNCLTDPTVDPDYVGWRMQCYVDGVALKPTFHSLRYGGWSEDARGYYRDVSHLNPIRQTIATRGSYRDAQPPEDVNWANQVRPYVKTECYVDRVMYHYRSSPGDSTWRRGPTGDRTFTRPVVNHANFGYHRRSST